MKIIRVTTVPVSLNAFCKDLLRELQEDGYEVVAVSSPGPEMEMIAKREGVKTIAVPMERHISPLKDLKSLINLIKVFRSEKPDMVHSMTPKAGLLSMMAAKICKVPIRIHTFTGLVFPTSTGLKQKVLIFTDRLTCQCATHIVPEGNGVKNDLERFKITDKPLQVLGHGNVKGIDLDLFDPKNENIIKEAAKIRKKGIFTFIFIGRIVGDKGINELIKAFKQLNTEYTNTRLLLVGKTENNIDPISTETAKEMKNNSAIEHVGIQSDVRPWLAASDALILPSYREGFPNVVLEAGAMGLPSIVTDINGSREIIINGINGIIIPTKNILALQKAMKEFIDNPAMVKQMSREARPLITSRFEKSYVKQCLKDYYKNLFQNTSRLF